MCEKIGPGGLTHSEMLLLLMAMLDYHLSQIGFTENEARLYIELLRIGSQPVSVLAKRTRFNRSSTYSILKSLEGKGVVSSFSKRGVKYFSANDPNSLISYLDGKTRTLDYYRSELLNAIPKFRSLCNVFDFKRPVVSYFDGPDGVKHVMYDSLRAENYFYAYLCVDKWLEAGMKDFLIDYRESRINKRKIPMKGVSADTPKVKKFFEKDKNTGRNGMTEILYVEPKIFGEMFKNEMNIYDDKVAIMHLERGNEYGVLIENAEIAFMHKTIFEMVWNGMKR